MNPISDQVHEQQVHRRVADALADAERRRVDARGARLERAMLLITARSRSRWPCQSTHDVGARRP